MNRSQLSQFAVLLAVVEAGGFRRAALDLGIAPSAVSHAVSALEESLGIRLLARSTRSVAPTEEGRRLIETLKPALDMIASTVETLADSRAEPAGPLRITMPRLAADHIVVPRAAAFLALYPAIELELVINDRFEDIIERGFDAGLRLGEHLKDEMIAVRASLPMRGAVVGSPAYFSRHAPPQTPGDLLAHRCIRRRFSSGRLYRWEFEKDGRELVVDVGGPLILGDDRLILQPCLDGAGLAYLFDQRIADFIADGRLIRVLEDWCPPFDGFYIYYPTRRQMRPALRAFIDFFRV
jgi:DNA-binding transcriptional LysR family regulator